MVGALFVCALNELHHEARKHLLVPVCSMEW